MGAERDFGLADLRYHRLVLLLGLLNGLRALPFLITSPIAGVIADRSDRRNILIVCQYILMTATFIMGRLVAAGYERVWQIFFFTLITAWLGDSSIRCVKAWCLPWCQKKQN